MRCRRHMGVAHRRYLGAAQGAGRRGTPQRVNGQVWLIPHNPIYAPIPWPTPREDVTIEDATILGKVVAILRRV